MFNMDCDVHGCTSAAGAGSAGAADVHGRTSAAGAGSAGAADVHGRTSAAGGRMPGAANECNQNAVDNLHHHESNVRQLLLHCSNYSHPWLSTNTVVAKFLAHRA